MARPAPPPRTRLGFQDDTALMGPQQAAMLDRIKKAGGKDVRMNVIYGKLKQQGWQPYDQLVNAARARGLSVQATIMGTPQYAPTLDQGLAWNRNDPRQWQQFSNEVVRHLKGRVKRYSVGNEQNIEAFQQAPAGALAAGRQYRGIYRAGYAGIKAADPTAQVLMGELTSAPGARAFLQGALGGKGLKTSGLAYHPYDQADPRGQNTWDIDTLKELQATLSRYKRQGKLQTAKGKQAPLYLTEFGYQTNSGSVGQRAAKVARAYRLAQQAGARQFLSYQMAPTVRRTVQDPSVGDAYGNMFGGGRHVDPNWVWDTSLDPGALAAAMRPRKVSAARARAARVRKRGK